MLRRSASSQALASSAPSGTAPTALTSAEFSRFQKVIYKITGISFPDSKHYFVQTRINTRIAACGLRSAHEYLSFIEDTPRSEEVQHLINEMTVNETYFNRESYQFEDLINEILPGMTERRGRNAKVRFWIVPCSTGEEAYSLAIWLLEKWKTVDRFDVEIHASDIDTSVLAKAKAGMYSQRSLQGLPEYIVAKYFKKHSDNEWKIMDGLRKSVEFNRFNISDGRGHSLDRNFDVVLCRNLLIYFDDQSKAKAIGAIHAALNPGGVLFLGHSESLDRDSPLFSQVRMHRSTAYRKRG